MHLSLSNGMYCASWFVKIAGASRLPSIHTCVGANEERLTPIWYKEHGNYLSTSFLKVQYCNKKTIGGST